MSDQAPTVLINGRLYVPATDVVPTIDNVLQALYESYMGSGVSWNEDDYSLHISVNEDGEGISFEEFAARITEVATREQTG